MIVDYEPGAAFDMHHTDTIDLDTVLPGDLELLLDDPNLALAPSTVRYLREIQDSLHTMDEVINKLQQATTHQTRPYAGGSEILDLE